MIELKSNFIFILINISSILTQEEYNIELFWMFFYKHTRLKRFYSIRKWDLEKLDFDYYFLCERRTSGAFHIEVRILRVSEIEATQDTRTKKLYWLKWSNYLKFPDQKRLDAIDVSTIKYSSRESEVEWKLIIQLNEKKHPEKCLQSIVIWNIYLISINYLNL